MCEIKFFNKSYCSLSYADTIRKKIESKAVYKFFDELFNCIYDDGIRH